VFKETGAFPTLYLTLLLTQRAAKPGDHLSIRIDGTDAGSLTRGKVIQVDRRVHRGWERVGMVIGARKARVPSRWITAESPPTVITLEGYPATAPLYFDAPPIAPGDYRIRLDATHGNAEIGDLRARTATLYTELRMLALNDDGEARR